MTPQQMLTFEHARARALPQLASEWAGAGTIYVADWGWQDATDYALIVGSREAILGDDLSLIAIDDQQTYVDRNTGAVRRESSLDNLCREWEPVGNWPVQ